MNQHRKKKNGLEWIMFSLGLMLVVALVLYLGYDIWTAPSGPPRIEVTLGAASRQADQFRIPVELKNSGHSTAEQVQVEVVLEKGKRNEKSEFVIQHLPRGATRSGAVLFTTDPATADRVQSRVLGYQQP